ncbi:pentachlorophenol monooxygenase [Streptomyces globosus]|uniref:Pentachlorophenol monooxygenase n=1 Tax=Streptomyces globosus TaxID=68209 RepID=A0A344U071_9ACTN|nr:MULTISPECIES: FAD-dependent monooxygenase [Streptomyces]AXE24292.1 pentachlorophenol monooxygenase [Streptomyces globosus]
MDAYGVAAAGSGAETGTEQRRGRPGREPAGSGVLVVGAGPTGLALACDLARRGVRPLVVERSAGLFPGSRGKGIQPRTLEVFEDLGVLGAVLDRGGPAPVGMAWKEGVRLGEHRMFEEVAATEQEPYAEPWLVPQWATQEVLLARLHELGGKVSFGTALTGMAQDGEGVTAELAVADGATRTVRARYAVGADGGRSTVRRLTGIGMTGERVDPVPLVVADVAIDSLDRDHWHLFAPAEDGSRGYAALCPLPRTGLFQFVGQYHGTRAEPAEDEVRALIAGLTHIRAEDVREVRWASDFTVNAALADRFREGRVFLAGDAAHIHSPAGGQGLNTSVQDAYNLGWKLAAVLHDGAPEALLDTYEQERRPQAAEMLGLSTRIHRGQDRRGAATRQLGIHLRESPLSRETRTGLPEGALVAGDRAPDGRRDGIRLFDLFRGPHFTLLAVDTDLPEEVPSLPHLRAARISAYAAYGRGLFLIRPDGHIAWAGRSAADAEELAGWAAWFATPVGRTAAPTPARL